MLGTPPKTPASPGKKDEQQIQPQTPPHTPPSQATSLIDPVFTEPLDSPPPQKKTEPEKKVENPRKKPQRKLTYDALNQQSNSFLMKRKIINEIIKPIQDAIDDFDLLAPEKQDNTQQRSAVITALNNLKNKLERDIDNEIEKKFGKELRAQDKKPHDENLKLRISNHFENSAYKECANSTLELVTTITDSSAALETKKQKSNAYQKKCTQKSWSGFKIFALAVAGAIAGFVVGAVVGAAIGAAAGAGWGAIPGAVAGAFKGMALGISISKPVAIAGGLGALTAGSLTAKCLYKVAREEKNVADAVVEYTSTLPEEAPIHSLAPQR
jgi:outer membrane lipoprotein SlyB